MKQVRYAPCMEWLPTFYHTKIDICRYYYSRNMWSILFQFEHLAWWIPWHSWREYQTISPKKVEGSTIFDLLKMLGKSQTHGNGGLMVIYHVLSWLENHLFVFPGMYNQTWVDFPASYVSSTKSIRNFPQTNSRHERAGNKKVTFHEILV